MVGRKQLGHAGRYAPGRNRTCDLALRRRALYPLSYWRRGSGQSTGGRALVRSGPPTSWTVWLGDPDDMARRAEKALDRFRRLKLKLGGRDGLDVDRVRAVRGVAGDLPLQVDVNEAWSLEEALESLPALSELGVEYCEQPLPARDGGGPELKERSPLPIYVDEDCHTLADVAACAERAHGINVK